MKNCLVIVDLQNGFINENTAHLPHKIAEFISGHDCFDSIVATRYCNTYETACFRFGGWKECMSGTLASELVSDIPPVCYAFF